MYEISKLRVDLDADYQTSGFFLQLSALEPLQMANVTNFMFNSVDSRIRKALDPQFINILLINLSHHCHFINLLNKVLHGRFEFLTNSY